jgi:DNA-binding MarR family transcriptional regulator
MDESVAEPHPMSLAVLLRHAEGQIRNRLQPSLDEVGLSLDHWRILSVLQGRPGLRMTSIAEFAMVPNATLTRHVDLLVEHGLIVRRIDAADKRRVVAALSQRGESLVARLSDDERAVEREVMDGLLGRRPKTIAPTAHV